MMMLGPLGFAAPWLLAAGLALPVLWWMLRAVPPRPREVSFPGTALLAGLADPAPVARRTPWWLLALRLAAVAAAILALAGPVWRPAAPVAGDGPLLILVDAGWGAAPGWEGAQSRARTALDQAQAKGRPVALWLADGQGGRGDGPVFAPAGDAAAALRAAAPQPWATRYPADPAAFLTAAPAGFDTLWIADGAAHPGQAPLLAALAARGAVTVVPPARPLRALATDPGPRPALRVTATAPGPLPAVLAIGPDPQGTPRPLARLTPPDATAEGDGFAATLPLDLPPELRNRVIRFALEGEASAGAVVLADDALRRRKVALVGDARATEGQALLAPLHYLREALAPATDLIEGGLSEVLPAHPDVLVLVDAPVGAQAEALSDWVAGGGMLVRFAGPRLAAMPDLAAEPLLPVRLRPGGRAAGGALSWGEPREIAPFAADGIFAGLTIPAEVRVRAQLLPEPDPELPGRVLAALSDGTPLVTRGRLGGGQVVLVHSSANAEWSNLALSGLFVGMLERLVQSARAGGAEAGEGGDAGARNAVGLAGMAGRPGAGAGPGAETGAAPSSAPRADADTSATPGPGSGRGVEPGAEAGSGPTASSDPAGAPRPAGAAAPTAAPAAPGRRPEAPHWRPELVLDGFGRPQPPGAGAAPVAAADFAAGPAPGAPAGLYAAGERRAALNAGGPLAPARWPGATVESAATPPGEPLGGWLIALAALLLGADALGSAALAGTRRRRRAGVVA